MLFYVAGLALIVLCLVALVLKLEATGRKSEENEQMKQVLNDIHAATLARDRIDHDPAVARRMRDRFTR
jgi:hypothetical protein